MVDLAVLQPPVVMVALVAVAFFRILPVELRHQVKETMVDPPAVM